MHVGLLQACFACWDQVGLIIWPAERLRQFLGGDPCIYGMDALIQKRANQCLCMLSAHCTDISRPLFFWVFFRHEQRCSVALATGPSAKMFTRAFAHGAPDNLAVDWSTKLLSTQPYTRIVHTLKCSTFLPAEHLSPGATQAKHSQLPAALDPVIDSVNHFLVAVPERAPLQCGAEYCLLHSWPGGQRDTRAANPFLRQALRPLLEASNFTLQTLA